MDSVDIQVENALLHRKSSVTNRRLPATEPHMAAPIIMSHESLWIDSELIPREISELVADGALVTSGNDTLFDSSGVVVRQSTKNGRKISAVQKKVRIVLTRGDYNEYTTDEYDLRKMIHHNYSTGFDPVIEFLSEGNLTIVPSHLWNVHYMSGVITLDSSFTHTVIYLTAYLYCGRVGIDRTIKDATTDDIVEGVTNRFFTRELLVTHMNELASDPEGSSNFVLSISNSDHITEGVENKFFKQHYFDSAFSAKSIDDLQPSETGRLVNEETMQNLNLSIGGISEIGFSVTTSPPASKAGKLYMEQSEGRNVLFFEDSPVVGKGDIPVSESTQPQTLDGLGAFHGYFEGPTKGVHTGDVKGNVEGFVSDISNHKIIEAKILGNGEGHWVGTVNADVVGKFEGYAKIVTGSIDNASHLTVGTYDANAYVHVMSNDKHIQLSHTDGGSVLFECLSDSRMSVSCAALQTQSIICTHVECSQTLRAQDITSDQINCAGINNGFYGIFETGRIEDVTEIVAEMAILDVSHSTLATVSELVCDNAILSAAVINDCVLSTFSSSDAFIGNLKSTTLSVSKFHVHNLSFDQSIFLDNPNLVFNSLSVSFANVNAISVGNIASENITVNHGAEIHNLKTYVLNSDEISTKSLSISTLHLPQDFHLEFDTLSVNSLHSNTSYSLFSSVESLVAKDSILENISAQLCNASLMQAHAVVVNQISSSDALFDTLEAVQLDVVSVACGNCTTTTLTSDHIASASVDIIRLSCSALHGTNFSVDNSSSIHLDSYDGRFKYLSVNSLLSEYAEVNDQTVRKLSVSNVYSETAQFLTLSVQTLNSLNFKSGVHLSSTLSAHTSHTAIALIESLSVNNASSVRLTSSAVSTAYTFTGVAHISNTLSCGDIIAAPNIRASALSVNSVDCDRVMSSQLSVHSLRGEISYIGRLSVSNATFVNTFSSVMSCSALTCDDIKAPRANFDILSVNSIVGVDLQISSGGVTQHFVESLCLSISQSFEGALSLLSLQNIDGLATLSCANARVGSLATDSVDVQTLQGQSLSVSELTVSSLSVGTIHGVVLTQALSITGIAEHISTSSVTSSDLSCGTLFVDQIVRSVPHVSDVANPAVLTTSSLGDFALFSEDTKHLGDMMIHGSLYVTDTIFMGTEPAINIENVHNLVASSISVGELAVGMLTGIGGGTLGGTISDVVTNLLSVSPHDTIHEGNMQIEGNLVVSGVVLTGAHNKLMHNHGSFDMDGTLSVSSDIFSRGINIVDTILSIQAVINLLTSAN